MIHVIIFLTVVILICLFMYIYHQSEKKRINKEFYFTDEFPMYMISLERRKDRFDRTLENLKKYNFNNVKHFPAVDGKSLSDEYIKTVVSPDALEPIYKNVRTQHHELSIGAVGCYLSHINLWKLMFEQNFNFMLIFEDDTKPNKTFEELTSHLQNLPDDWDIFLGGGIYNNSDKISDSICKITSFYCLHVYFVRNTEKLKEIVNHSLPISKQIDWWMSDLVKEGKLNIYGLCDNSWMQLGEDTDIQTKIL